MIHKINLLIDLCNKVTVSVRAQAVNVQCKASLDCNGALSNDLGLVATARECCLDNPNALAYVSEEGICVPCVGEYIIYSNCCV